MLNSVINKYNNFMQYILKKKGGNYMSPLEAIREKCKECEKYGFSDIRNCSFSDCPFHPYRQGHWPIDKLGLTICRDIRSYCLALMNGSKEEVLLCSRLDCPLYPYRFGTNPNRKGIGGNPMLGTENNEPELETSET